MIEIEFRAKLSGKNTWIYGFLAEHNRIRSPLVGEWTVEEYTIGQYTGFRDKNGKKIYEGDILKTYNVSLDTESAGIVEWSNNNYSGHWGWELILPLLDESFTPYYGFVGWDSCEIIGNIHDNPELLKDGE